MPTEYGMIGRFEQIKKQVEAAGDLDSWVGSGKTRKRTRDCLVDLADGITVGDLAMLVNMADTYKELLEAEKRVTARAG